VPKAELYEKAKSVRMVSPYAKRIMKHEQFTTLPNPESVLLIAVTPEDLGFTERPTMRAMAPRLSCRATTAKKSLGAIMAGQDRFIVKDESYSKRGPLRTMLITIGGVPKDKLLEQVTAVRYVSPYAERIMKHENFTTLEKPESTLLIVLTPKDFRFTQRAYVADLLHPDRLAAWSKGNLDVGKSRSFRLRWGHTLRSNIPDNRRTNFFGWQWIASRVMPAGLFYSTLSATTTR
jgi:hypothetical protein